MGGVLNRDPVLIQALQEVSDPEFPISIVDMGLIYGVEMQGNTAHVTMTYTSTGCGCMQWIESDIKKRLLQEESVHEVEIEVVWSPAWTVDQMSEAGRKILKSWGVSSK
ncbi:metal-sulfur cluster assembly factor [Peribacillus frigoritolerans]|uniref:metal-sulfur cluster assembly factor n=1 Tax=Peribacillus frigoritolerans TaxID=450367 RepID=UPI00207AB3DB|nr:metal-sulfur cluster assembly factor [Peribacillus frigoritolerans]USK67006.1 metal-sulfur cluster assembly factor [Peribacillus frigoritolerans]